MRFLRKHARSRHHNNGQSLVEAAFVILIFLFLLFGIIEFGRALWTYNTIVQSTRAAARWAVVNVTSDTDTTNKDRAKNVVVYGYPDVSSGNPILPGLSTGLVTVGVQPIEVDSAGRPISQKISVKVTGYIFRFLVPIAPTMTIPAFETSLFTESMGAIG
jgi:Flp pilus assembly protein TadG